MSKINQPLSTD